MTSKQSDSIEFQVLVNWTGGKEGDIFVEGKPQLRLSSPVYWDGHPNLYSPQDLFVVAVAGCYITTLASMMTRMKQPLHSHTVKGRGVLNHHPEGGWQFTDIYVKMEIAIPKGASLPKVKRAIELTKKYCHITRSVTSKIHVKVSITQLD